MRNTLRKTLLLALFVGSLLLASCSPEYTRVRAGGMGADVGNRQLGPALDIHGPVNPSFGEPEVGKAIKTENRS